MKCFCIFVLCVLLLNACSAPPAPVAVQAPLEAASTNTSAPPTVTAQPSAIPSATVIPSPTYTSTPVYTATPAPTATRVLPTSEPGEAVELTWYITNTPLQVDLARNLVFAFNKQYPTIKIRLITEEWSEFDRTLEQLWVKKNMPDVFTHSGSLGFRDFVNRGMVADLTPFIETENYDLQDFLPETLAPYQINNRLYGLPILTGGTYIFYNKGMFDRAGLPYPPADWDDTTWTWDKFAETCQALTRTDDQGNTSVFGCYISPSMPDQIPLMWGQNLYEDQVFTTGLSNQVFLDTKGSLQAFKSVQELIYKQKAMPSPDQFQALRMGDPFREGRVAMMITGVWGWWDYRSLRSFNWGVAALPYGASDRYDVMYTDPLMMSNRTNHPYETWEFIKFLSSEEAQAMRIRMTWTPPTRRSQLPIWYEGFTMMTAPEVETTFLGSLQYGVESPNHMVMEWTKLNPIVLEAYNQVIKGPSQVAKLLNDYQKRLESQALMIIFKQMQK
jgi:multiple sugar transport system substrate-binding protein